MINTTTNYELNGNKVWFTSDLHLYHNNILTIGKGRPFSNMQEMITTIIKNWNKVVSEEDNIYVLGDVFWGKNSKEIKDILQHLNGHKYLILGNHDRVEPNLKSGGWEDISYYKEIVVENKLVILSHYPIFEWNGYYNNSYHLYGHVHGNLDLRNVLTKPNKNCLDVGVDTNNFTPINFTQILKKLA